MNIENQKQTKNFVDEQFLNELIEIYEDIKNGDLKDENYNDVIFAGHLIRKFKEKNIKIEDITKDVIYEFQHNGNHPLWHILTCVNSVYDFYDPKLSKKYIITCYIDNDEIIYCKAKIIGDIEKLDLSRNILEKGDVEKIIDLENDEFVASEDLNEYQGRNKILKAMSIIRKEFPGGTQFVAINI